jgi:hypothetical protein
VRVQRRNQESRNSRLLKSPRACAGGYELRIMASIEILLQRASSGWYNTPRGEGLRDLIAGARAVR